jgi:hypothetical protein
VTPEDITADLSNHLRSQGTAVDPTALKAFAADFRDKPAGDRDIEALARRFKDWQRAVRDRKRAKAWVEGACLAGIGAVFLGIGAIGLLFWIIDRPTTAVDATTAATIWFLITGGIMAFGAAIVAFGLVWAIRSSRRLAAEAESDGSP